MQSRESTSEDTDPEATAQQPEGGRNFDLDINEEGAATDAMPPPIFSFTKPPGSPPCDQWIVARLNQGKRPGWNEEWKTFCDGVRTAAGMTTKDKGFSDSYITARTRFFMKKGWS